MGGETFLGYRLQTIVNLSQSDRIFTSPPRSRPLVMCIRRLFLVGTARCAVRAASSGATSVAGRYIARSVPRALRAVTAVAEPLAKSAVPTY